jgi:hypothetical protein
MALSSLVLLLTLSGYALYYFGSEDARPWISVLHWGIGIVAPLVLVWHIVSGRSATPHKHPVAPIGEQADKTVQRENASQRIGQPQAGEKKRRREAGGV